MFYKKLSLIFGILIGIQSPVFAKFENPLLDPKYVADYPQAAQLHATFGDKSEIRKMVEQLFLVIVHGGSQLQNGKLLFSLKQGITTARDALQKKATYGLLDKTVREIKALHDIAEKHAQSKGNFDKEAFEQAYKDTVKIYVGDACDFIFRGINYMNNPLKEQTVTAYLKDDIIPYFIKKKIVWLTQRAIRQALECSPQGALIAGAYDIACVIPVVGTELEELPKIALEFVYDKGMNAGKIVRTTINEKLMPTMTPLADAILKKSILPMNGIKAA